MGKSDLSHLPRHSLYGRPKKAKPKETPILITLGKEDLAALDARRGSESRAAFIKKMIAAL